ncbi:MAG TPA: nucleotidyltransferase domain-containing protein [Kiritimatiellia bacterium]|nr:nucleotidyltransferase domain-containing protein [Kiritimatiellia bacterium]HQF20780.1 nucleotidyltransferase domain-containing protein [Kiritimatiellia bacterium]
MSGMRTIEQRRGGRSKAAHRRGAGRFVARLPANAEIGLPDGLLREITGRIVREYAPERIVLFGSRARGDARPDSDIDLFVEMESSQNFYRRTAEVLGLFGVRPWALDLLVYTPREVERERGLLGLIVDEVESEGIALYEQKATKR